MALTFDDGPSESTRDLLDILDEFGVKATFFQCGFHARRLKSEAAEIARRGHEIGNHGDTTRLFTFTPPSSSTTNSPARKPASKRRRECGRHCSGLRSACAGPAWRRRSANSD